MHKRPQTKDSGKVKAVNVAHYIVERLAAEGSTTALASPAIIVCRQNISDIGFDVVREFLAHLV